ncbi:periodic tryptophan protein 2 homolog [Prorops nasuta]|uniref:periodic tryptophan protein 2 homolog n=1 Tax=Prorops nasuta TaxID=863751 RepID=UPI0034CDDA19
MKFSYKFSNLLGTVYRKGNLLFSPDGNSVISPVGNRISIFDLKNNKSMTLPVESDFNYTAIDISPNGSFLIAINEEGEAHIISLITKIIMHKYKFKKKIRCVKFSPDGKYFAVCKENNVFIFSAPHLQNPGYNPFIMERVFHGFADETTFINWSFDSKLIAIGSKDTVTRLYSLQKWANFKHIILGCHSDEIVICFFEKNSYDISTLSRNGQLCIWECSIDPDDLVEWQPPAKKEKVSDSDSEDDIDIDNAIEKTQEQSKKYKAKALNPGDLEENNEATEKINNEVKKLQYKKLARHYLSDVVHKFDKDANLTAAAYHQKTCILVVGFSNGHFYVYEMPDVNLIHSLNISNQQITAVSFNCTGDWIAFGCSEAGQLLVWEWQSETYAMKQQAHSNNMNCLTYSGDGLYIATGGDDGKVKLWNTFSGFCTVTFQEHTSGITGVLFSHNRKFVASASLDGTCRAYDLTRYRNFRTLTSPRPVQFSCLAIDSSDEFLAAGGQDVFEIYLWSMKLGTLLEILSGHEGPVVSLAFSPSLASTELASVSWDKTLKIWNAIENGSNHETIQLTADGLCVTYKPNGEEVAVASLDAQITFFHCKTATQIGSIEGRNDLGSGRLETDLVTAKQSLQGKAFTSLCYSSDGTCILAGGQSKNICIYHIQESVLLKKFEVTQNRSLDGVNDIIDRKCLTEFGNLALVEEREESEGGNIPIRLPGVRSGDMASRKVKPEIRVYSLQFSPTGQAWASATTEGLLIYSLDVGLVFDPFELDIGITPETVEKTLKDQEYSKALMMASKLNEKPLLRHVIEDIPYQQIELIVTNLPSVYAERILKFVAAEFESSRHIQFYLIWISTILTHHGSTISGVLHMPLLLLLQKNLQQKYDDLCKICDFNEHTMSYLLKLGEIHDKKSAVNEEESDSDDSLMEKVKEIEMS